MNFVTSPNYLRESPRRKYWVLLYLTNLQLRLRGNHHLIQAPDNILHLHLPSPEQLLASGYIINQPNSNARTPDTDVRITLLVHQTPTGTRNEVLYILKLSISAALNCDDLHRHLVLEDTRSVMEGPEDVDSIALCRGHNLFLDVLMDRSDERWLKKAKSQKKKKKAENSRLDGAHKACT